MVVYELPATREAGALRALTLGSCRVRNPLFVLRDQGLLRIRGEGPTPTHTAEEAAQSLALFMGEMDIPDFLDPYVFETPTRPEFDRLGQLIAEEIDVFLLEVSDYRQFSFRGVKLNQNFVTRHLVKPRRGALLDWYREISRGEAAREETIEAARAKLRAAGFTDEGPIVDLLRHVQLTTCDPSATAATIGDLARRLGGQWVIVGPFAIPGNDSDLMGRRRALARDLADAAAAAGALFYDPTKLLVEYGATTALADEGVNVYEYAETFYPRLGRALLAQVRSVGPAASGRRGAQLALAGPAPARARPPASALTVWMEAKARLARSGLRRVARRMRSRPGELDAVTATDSPLATSPSMRPKRGRRGGRPPDADASRGFRATLVPAPGVAAIPHLEAFLPECDRLVRAAAPAPRLRQRRRLGFQADRPLRPPPRRQARLALSGAGGRLPALGRPGRGRRAADQPDRRRPRRLL